MNKNNSEINQNPLYIHEKKYILYTMEIYIYVKLICFCFFHFQRTPEPQKEQPEANNNNNNASTIHILPKFCNFTSSTVFLPFIPFIAQWVPFCTSHFKCGWLYITVIGTAAFLLAFLLALICNLCCCRRRQR